MFDHIWFWKASRWRPVNRKGQACRINHRGRLNSIEVEFPDGFKVITSRYAVRKVSNGREFKN